MANFIDISGRKFHRLTAISRAIQSKENRPQYLCICDCGNKIIVRSEFLRRGHTKSCGCIKNERMAEFGFASKKHGHCTNGSNSKIYQIWANMWDRCSRENNHAYPDYGGRGISVCDRWKSFENFLSDMRERPKGRTLNRINNDGNYCPENCNWATRSEQQRNRRTTPAMLNHFKKMRMARRKRE